MPDLKTLEQSLNEKCTDGQCEACGENEWNIATSAYVLTAIGDEGIEFGQGTQVLPLFCRNCGYTRLHAIDYL